MDAGNRLHKNGIEARDINGEFCKIWKCIYDLMQNWYCIAQVITYVRFSDRTMRLLSNLDSKKKEWKVINVCLVAN